MERNEKNNTMFVRKFDYNVPMRTVDDTKTIFSKILIDAIYTKDRDIQTEANLTPMISFLSTGLATHIPMADENALGFFTSFLK